MIEPLIFLLEQKGKLLEILANIRSIRFTMHASIELNISKEI